MKTRMHGTAPTPSSTRGCRPRRRRDGFVAVTEASVCLTALAVLAIGMAFVPGGAAATDAASPAEFQAVRKLAAVGPEGGRVAVLTDDSCVVYDLAEGDASPVWVRAADDRVTAIAGQSNGAGLAVCWCDGRVRLIDTKSSEPRWERPVVDAPISSAAFAPDGSVLAIGTGKGELILLESATGEVRHRAVVGGDVRVISFTPCGERLIVPSEDGSLSIRRVSTAVEERRISAVSGSIVAMAVRPDGKSAVVASNQGLVSIVGLTGAESAKGFFDAHLPVLSVAFSADGDRLLVGSFGHAIRLYSADGAREVRELEGHRLGTRALLPTANGMLSAGLDGRLVAWNLATGRGRDVPAY